jgi:hypothetical protein
MDEQHFRLEHSLNYLNLLQYNNYMNQLILDNKKLHLHYQNHLLKNMQDYKKLHFDYLQKELGNHFSIRLQS